MTSHVYLAIGELDGVRVMKVGKANNVKKRQAQIRISIRSTLECPSAMEAFALEGNLRRLARKLGAKGIPNHIDWFIFDEAIYEELETFVISSLFLAPREMYLRHVSLDDLEIEAIKARYKELVAKKPEPSRDPLLDADLNTLRTMRDQLQGRHDELVIDLEETRNEIARLAAELELRQAELKALHEEYFGSYRAG